MKTSIKSRKLARLVTFSTPGGSYIYVRDCEPAVTFDDGYQAHTMTGGVVTVPDQVAADQKRFDGDVFPVIRRDGSRARARLMGDAYGLHTSGTGDMVVAIV